MRNTKNIDPLKPIACHGGDATILTTNGREPYIYVGYAAGMGDNNLYGWTREGKNIVGCESGFDIFNIQEPPKMIHEPSEEADELHDILMMQRDQDDRDEYKDDPIHRAIEHERIVMAKEFDKLALHQRMTEALEDCLHWLNACNAYEVHDRVSSILDEIYAIGK